MASYYSYAPQHQQQQQQPQQAQQPNHTNHHGGRSRRQSRLSSQNSHRQFRGVRSMKELAEAPVYSAFRTRFEACKGFELDDDLEFCPGLLTEDDVCIWLSNTTSLLTSVQLQSISSSSSDRSSLSSDSLNSSPIQQPAQVSPPFSTLQPYTQAYQPRQLQPSQLKIHQPAAQRARSAIPIVDPTTMQRVNSPPTSISPARFSQPHTYNQRRW